MTTNTHADFWRNRNKPVERALPSGAVVLLKKASALSLVLENGMLPDTFAVTANQLLGAGQAATTTPEEKRANLAGIADIMETVIREAFLSPVIVAHGQMPDYDQNQIAYSDLDDEDKLYVFEYALGEGKLKQQTATFPR